MNSLKISLEEKINLSAFILAMTIVAILDWQAYLATIMTIMIVEGVFLFFTLFVIELDSMVREYETMSASEEKQD